MNIDKEDKEIDWHRLNYFESDRAIILITTTIIDDILKQLFLALFNDNRFSKEIFDYNGPLSSFSAKIKIAYLLGIINIEVYNDLETIRKLRNTCAHEYNHINFSQKKIKLIVENLNCTKEYYPDHITGPLDKKQEEQFDIENELKMEAIAQQKGYVKVHKTNFIFGIMKIHLYIQMLIINIIELNIKIKSKTILNNILISNTLWNTMPRGKPLQRYNIIPNTNKNVNIKINKRDKKNNLLY